MKRGREDDDAGYIERSKNDRENERNSVERNYNEWDREMDNADDIKRGESDCNDETNGVDGENNGYESRESDDAEEVEMTCDHCHCEFEGDGSGGDDDSVTYSRIDSQKVQRALGKLICSSDVKPRSVKNEFFKNYINSLYPEFEIDFDTVKGDCLQIYEEEKARVKHILKNIDGQISLSVDVLRYYKRDGSSYEFMCLAAHFIDNSWKWRKWVLSFRRVNDFNCDWLDKAIRKSLKYWEIEGKISNLTLLSIDDDEKDEIVENVKTLVQVKKRLQLNGRLFRVNCCAAIFNLMVEDAFKEISNIIDKVRELSWSKSLPLWYLTTSKLQNALELETMGEFSSEDVRKFYDVPSQDEWKKVECVCKLAESAYTISKVLFETKHPTANIYLYNLQELRSILTQESISSCDFTRKVAMKMLQRLDRYCKNAFMILAVASVMDPCYKMKYIEYVSSKFEGTDGSSQVALVLDAIRSLYDDYVNHAIKKKDSESDSTSAHAEKELSRSVEQGLDDSNWVQEYSKFIQTNGQPLKSDLDLYLEEPVLPWSPNFSALRWWRAEGPKYPTLSKMARDFLSIPMSVATSYDAYYTEPREVDGQVISGPDLMNALMCTRSWAQKRKQ